MADEERTQNINDLIQKLHSENANIRVSAARALGQMRDTRALEPLIVALHDIDWNVRAFTAWALGMIGDARAIEPLIAALRDESGYVRASAAAAMGEIGDTRAAESLIVALSDEDSDVRSNAAWALRILGVENDLAARILKETEDSAKDIGTSYLDSWDGEELEDSSSKPKAPAPRSLEEAEAVPPLPPPPPAPPAGPPQPAPEPQREAEESKSITEAQSQPSKPAQSAGSVIEDVLQPQARARQATADQTPHFSTFYPAAVKPNQPYALMAFVHLESALTQVREIAAGYAGMMGGQQESGTAPSRIAVDVGGLITFVPHVPGIQFNPAESVVTWQPPHQSATFLFTTPADLRADTAGELRLHAERPERGRSRPSDSRRPIQDECHHLLPG